ncbi:transcriptional regulator GlxA family with amidase domain [Kutzneria viridogrisea]|uniref:Transcriptional regulator GlxA family with amidase domain n=1 Tax=Kutzneria viridogrisea TaxID=47990 RepID=A0ABR6BA95_9PSEU|nr:transcriptional regulator GlxA family with amidase domain [Kutzneria viridogrisea]
MERRDFLKGTVAATGAIAVGPLAAPAASAADKTGREGPLRVQILMFDGVEEQDFVGPVEVLGHAVHAGGQVRTTLVRPGVPGEVVATFGTRIAVPTAWHPTDADLLIVPGGGYAAKDGPGVNALIKDREVLRNLVRAHQAGMIIAGVCTGVMVLSAAGLTRGRPCTTHHLAKADLTAQKGQVVDARVVDDGDLVTAGGVTSGLDLALWLVTRELGSAVSVGVESVLEYEQRGAVWQRP